MKYLFNNCIISLMVLFIWINTGSTLLWTQENKNDEKQIELEEQATIDSQKGQDDAENNQACSSCQPAKIGTITEAMRISSVGAKRPKGYVPIIPSGGPNLPIAISTLWEYLVPGAPNSSTPTQPKVADLDGDGTKEVIFGLMNAYSLPFCVTPVLQAIYVLDQSGNLKSGFPVNLPTLNTPTLDGYLSIVGIANVIGAPSSALEIVVATGRSPYGGGIYILSHTGQILQLIQPNKGFSGTDFQHAVLADLDGDGKAEIITQEYGVDMLFVFRGDDTIFPGWPQSLGGAQYTITSEPAVVDFGDGLGPAIIANVWPTGGAPGQNIRRVIAFNSNGTIRWQRNTLYPLPLVIGDVTGDGILDVVVKENAWPPSGIWQITILDKNGNLITSWPTSESWSYGNKLALGDLNSDGKAEIINHDAAKVYVTDYLGNHWPGFPRWLWDGQPQPPRYTCGLLIPDVPYCSATDLGIADMDGDGKLDIYGIALNQYRTGAIGDHGYALFAWKGLNGATVPGFPFPLLTNQALGPLLCTFGEQYPPTIAEMTINNIPTLVAVTSKGWGRIEAVSLYPKTPPAEEVYKPPKCWTQCGASIENTKVGPTECL